MLCDLSASKVGMGKCVRGCALGLPNVSDRSCAAYAHEHPVCHMHHAQRGPGVKVEKLRQGIELEFTFAKPEMFMADYTIVF